MAGPSTEELNEVAMRDFGRSFAECTTVEQDAVESSWNTATVIAMMKANGAETLGELVAKMRARD